MCRPGVLWQPTTLHSVPGSCFQSSSPSHLPRCSTNAVGPPRLGTVSSSPFLPLASPAAAPFHEFAGSAKAIARVVQKQHTQKEGVRTIAWPMLVFLLSVPPIVPHSFVTPRSPLAQRKGRAIPDNGRKRTKGACRLGRNWAVPFFDCCLCSSNMGRPGRRRRGRRDKRAELATRGERERLPDKPRSVP